MGIPNARERILEAAVKVFADKSFEGSRIDEIAREASVPKSLIYYHFKSKDEILEVLITNFINEYKNIIAENAAETHSEKAEQLVGRMKSVYYDFGQRNADLVRVIMIDSLKKTNEKPAIFRMIEAIIETEMKYNKDPGYDSSERMIAEFFTSFLPNCAFICFADAWTKYFNIDSNQYNQLYLKAYEQTHGEYHKNHELNEKEERKG
jgi:AcrR family transcriptional regulator